jgi:hypothetical protein
MYAWDFAVQVTIWCVTGLLGWLVGRVTSNARDEKTERAALYAGVRALLRSAIMSAHHEAMRDGFISTTDREVMERAYTAYHSLGGNGVATRLYDEASALQTREHDWEKDRKE